MPVPYETGYHGCEPTRKSYELDCGWHRGRCKPGKCYRYPVNDNPKDLNEIHRRQIALGNQTVWPVLPPPAVSNEQMQAILNGDSPMTDPNSEQPRELRYKGHFAKAFDGGQAHWGDELSMGMIAEYASEVACALIARATREARRLAYEDCASKAGNGRQVRLYAKTMAGRLVALDNGEGGE